jgi:FkbM family methyltransferase
MLTSYAANLEDILLHRALGSISSGFYIDVGANDPINGSVTKLFYDQGWRGINIDPNAKYIGKLNGQRPRDVNLNLAASDKPGLLLFHEMQGSAHELSTTRPDVADAHAANGVEIRSYDVVADTLTAICERHKVNDIHFLKVDVEGAEEAVFRGFDLRRFRPWIIVAETSVVGMTNDADVSAWNTLLCDASYKFVHFDGVNRYYVAAEHTKLTPFFALPVDIYERYNPKDVADALLLRHKPLKWATTNAAALLRRCGDLLRHQNQQAPEVD